MKTAILFLIGVALVAVCSGKTGRSITTIPQNDADLDGDFSLLTCAVQNAAQSRVQWYEFNTDIDGRLISDNLDVSPSHPYASRYRIVNTTANTFNLLIDPVEFELDGGSYSCVDTLASTGIVYSNAKLIILATNTNCTSVMPTTGHVVEGYNYTIECYIEYQGGVAPDMWWTGPNDYYSTVVPTPTTVWSILYFTADRSMTGQRFSAKTNFTSSGFQQPDYATNTPTYSFTYTSITMQVEWGPKNTYMVPIQDTYEIGSVITCYTDAFPPPTYTWQSLHTGERWYTQGVVLRSDMVGSQVMRCQVQNFIDGVSFTQNIFRNITVNAPVTTTIPPTVQSTPEPPAEGVCTNPSGTWYSDAGEEMCLDVDLANNGRVSGLMRPLNKAYYVEMFGVVDLDSFDESGYTAILPKTEGITAYVGECHMCYGVEHILMNSVTRSSSQMADCDVAGPITRNAMSTFARSDANCGFKAGATRAEIHRIAIQSQIAAGVLPAGSV